MSAKLCKYTYFYIHDHLGSTSMVLDVDGNISQSVTYIPYGEIFVEERNGAWNSPYLFNSKELDEETGFYYYGARYLNPTSGMWLSVDPLFEKYVGTSPYNYCAGNPVKLVDVDGRRIEIKNEEGEIYKYEPGISKEHTDNSPYVNDAIKALNHLYDSGDEKIQNVINTLVGADISYIIGYTGENENSYDADKPVVEGVNFSIGISWDNHSGLKTDIGVVLSPTNGLYHELGHAMECLSVSRNPDDEVLLNRAYGENNELIIIKEYETHAAKVLGEFNPTEKTPYTRNRYNGKGQKNIRFNNPINRK